jgi:hypothetical protein
MGGLILFVNGKKSAPLLFVLGWFVVVFGWPVVKLELSIRSRSKGAKYICRRLEEDEQC